MLLSSVIDWPNGRDVGREVAEVPRRVLSLAHTELFAVVQRPEMVGRPHRLSRNFLVRTILTQLKFPCKCSPQGLVVV